MILGLYKAKKDSQEAYKQSDSYVTAKDLNKQDPHDFSQKVDIVYLNPTTTQDEINDLTTDGYEIIGRSDWYDITQAISSLPYPIGDMFSLTGRLYASGVDVEKYLNNDYEGYEEIPDFLDDRNVVGKFFNLKPRDGMFRTVAGGVMEVMLRPQDALFTGIYNAQTEDNDVVLGNVKNFATGAFNGLTGNSEEVRMTDIGEARAYNKGIDDYEPNKLVMLAGEIFLDPLWLLPPAKIAKGISRGAKVISKSSKKGPSISDSAAAKGGISKHEAADVLAHGVPSKQNKGNVAKLAELSEKQHLADNIDATMPMETLSGNVAKDMKEYQAFEAWTRTQEGKKFSGINDTIQKWFVPQKQSLGYLTNTAQDALFSSGKIIDKKTLAFEAINDITKKGDVNLTKVIDFLETGGKSIKKIDGQWLKKGIKNYDVNTVPALIGKQSIVYKGKKMSSTEAAEIIEKRFGNTIKQHEVNNELLNNAVLQNVEPNKATKQVLDMQKKMPGELAELRIEINKVISQKIGAEGMKFFNVINKNARKKGLTGPKDKLLELRLTKNGKAVDIIVNDPTAVKKYFSEFYDPKKKLPVNIEKKFAPELKNLTKNEIEVLDILTKFKGELFKYQKDFGIIKKGMKQWEEYVPHILSDKAKKINVKNNTNDFARGFHEEQTRRFAGTISEVNDAIKFPGSKYLETDLESIYGKVTTDSMRMSIPFEMLNTAIKNGDIIPYKNFNELKDIQKIQGKDRYVKKGFEELGYDSQVAKKLADRLGFSNIIIDERAALVIKNANNIGKKNAMLKLYDNYFGLYKGAKLLTPGYHLRNFTGNSMNMYLTGVDLKDVYANLGAFARDKRIYKKVVNKKNKGISLTKSEAKVYDNMSGFIRNNVGVGTAAVADVTVGQYNSMFGKANRATSREGVGKAIIPVDKIIDLNYAMGGHVDNGQRYAVFLQALKNPKKADKWLGSKAGKMDPYEKASEFTKASHFDYSNLSLIEANVLRRIVPFYTWGRKNIFLQSQVMWKNPHRINRITNFTKETYRQSGMNPEDMPEHLAKTGAISMEGLVNLIPGSDNFEKGFFDDKFVKWGNTTLAAFQPGYLGGNPLMNGLKAFQSGEDQFSGKSYVDEGNKYNYMRAIAGDLGLTEIAFNEEASKLDMTRSSIIARIPNLSAAIGEIRPDFLRPIRQMRRSATDPDYAFLPSFMDYVDPVDIFQSKLFSTKTELEMLEYYYKQATGELLPYLYRNEAFYEDGPMETTSGREIAEELLGSIKSFNELKSIISEEEINSIISNI